MTRYVFIVGKPRSGTSLVRAVLAQSRDAELSAAKHHRSPPSVARSLVQLVFGRTPEAPESLNRATELDSSAAPGAESARVEIADGKALANIYHVPTLIERHPDTRIVHVIRDVRGVFYSQQEKWRVKGNRKHRSRVRRLIHRIKPLSELYTVVSVSIVWLRIMQLDTYYRLRYPNHYCSVRYEDFLENAETASAELCRFLGIHFSRRMLQITFDNSSFAAAVGRQAAESSVGIDPGRANLWRGRIHPLTEFVLRTVAAKQLRRLGYETVSSNER